MSLTLRDKSKTKFKNGVVVALSIFALVAQPVYTVVDSAVANAVAGKTIQAGTYFADDSDCDRNVVTPKCTTIGAAVAAAQDGDIVLLRSNFSPASEILVNKNITIDGNGRTVWG